MPSSIDLAQIEADIDALETEFGVEVQDSLIEPAKNEYPFIHVLAPVYSVKVFRTGPDIYTTVAVDPKRNALLIKRMKEILGKLPTPVQRDHRE